MTTLIVLAAIITATVFGIYIANNPKDMKPGDETRTTSERIEAAEQQHTQPTEKKERQQKAGTYTNYTETLAKQAANNKKVVLFFHAAWCPTCRTLDKTLLKETIPEGIAIFKIDYDQEETLKEKYRINKQHTLVLVNEDLKEIKRWSGSRNSKDIASQIQ